MSAMMRAAAMAALIVVVAAAPRDAHAESGATLLRIFFHDGTFVVCYGEYARVDDRVIVSLPAGGTADTPRLHVATLPAGLVDWERTERYAHAARAARYAATRGDEDFERLSMDVARVLSAIAKTTDRGEALAIAEAARRVLADWPRAHYGYRQDEVRDIVSFLDGAIMRLRNPAVPASFELSFVATAMPETIELVDTAPAAREQLDHLLRVVRMTSLASERVALLQSALLVLGDAAAAAPEMNWGALRKSIERDIKAEHDVDAKYAALTGRLLSAAMRAAARADVSGVERTLAVLPAEDERLGRERPDIVLALRTTLDLKLEAARDLRLRRDRWLLRQDLYRDYSRSVGSPLLRLVKEQPSLEAIRRLDGPAPDRLRRLQAALSGGAEALDRMAVPDDLRAAHDLLVSAWRFAEGAVRIRFDAIRTGSLDVAREASSAAAGALMLLTRAQQEVRVFLEPPRIQ